MFLNLGVGCRDAGDGEPRDNEVTHVSGRWEARFGIKFLTSPLCSLTL